MQFPNVIPILLFSFLSSTAFPQKQVIVRGIIIENDYDEYSEDQLNEPGFQRLFFETLENALHKKLGHVAVEYAGEKKITFIDPRRGNTFREAVEPYQEYYRQRSEAKKQAYDYLVEVRTRLSDVFKGARSNITVTSRVILKDSEGKSVLRRSGKVVAYIPEPDFNENNLLIDRVELKQAFPLSSHELQTFLINSLTLAFAEDNNKMEITASDRPNVHIYDSILNTAIHYRLLAPMNFAKSRFKLKLLGFYTITRNRPVILTRLSDNTAGSLNFRETKITDIDFGVGLKNVAKVYRFQRTFKVGIETRDIPNSNYFIMGTLYTDNFLGGVGSNGPVRLIVKRKDEESNGELRFTTRNYNTDSQTLSQYNRSVGRIFSAAATLDGTVADKQITIQSSPVCINALEILIDGKLAGLISHPLTTRKYLRKNKKLMPFIVSMVPQLSLEEEALVLQSFQFNRLAYLLKDYQDHIVNRMASESD